jgi:hypothetical protein
VTDTKQLYAAIDRDYLVDIARLQEEFRRVNVADRDSLRAWFLTHPYLTTHDHARVASVTQKTVYRWRRRAGFGPVARAKFPTLPPGVAPRRHLPPPVAPAAWDDRWLVEQYLTGYSVGLIAAAVHRSYPVIYARLKRHNVLRDRARSLRSLNPCCTRRWVTEHYVERGLSKRRCARLAGVTRLTFSNWLDGFGVRARSAVEQAILDNVTDLGKKTAPIVPQKR